MRRLALLPIILTASIAATPAVADAPNAALKSQLRMQKAKVAKLKTQLATAKATIRTLNGQIVTLTGSFAQAQTDLATRTAERDTANAALGTAGASLAAQTTLTSQAAAGALSGLSPDQLWVVIGALYPLMPNADVCGYSRSFYSSGSYTSYSFTRYIC